ncbi:DUF134 domain-containing protein [Fusibacter paucivorans]|uniref:UPF0251 protein KHM83_11040 n=1 Tax=Fusibacter paucivorans TaxID=76009 RepID=A0ABS5PQ90_9FIRM|nr:DUF134 domain-containing protein [Fusibacter paucivorans]MBS7527216.1 DUF134 domain-containing protein [Fusibacter paucivorans]
MARPRKGKIVCEMPKYARFGPKGQGYTGNANLVMTVEEYESIRLMDYEGMNQEESAKKMEIGRSTFQRIYDDARKKIAQSLVEGRTINIEGGDYKICENLGECRKGGCCRRQQIRGVHQEQ